MFETTEDEYLQEKFFEITVQHEGQSSNKLIGTVVVDLGPLITNNQSEDKEKLEAWFPIYNFEQGLRGDLKV